MSNVIQFPMDRIQLSPKAFDFFSDRVDQQSFELESQTLDILNQAKALEEQSERILQMMEERFND
mgnify:CR=1 FL=1